MRKFVLALTILLTATWGHAQTTQRVDLLAMGDWGRGNADQKLVANALADYAQHQVHPLAAMILLGDNFYVPLHDSKDPLIQTVFEQMYDRDRLAMPFYVALGNHDYEQAKDAPQAKAEIELEYAKLHPESRWKMPSKWYRVDFPADHPLVTALILDSDQQKLSENDWKAEAEWMDQELAKPRTATWVICCAHHDMFGNGSHGDNGVLQNTWGPLFKKYHVDFYLCGHEHTMQHLDIPGWETTFIISGGGGAARKPMLRDARGPFSKSVLGFTHLTFDSQKITVRLLDGQGTPLHVFERSKGGEINVLLTEPSDKATTKPLRVIQNLPDTARQEKGGIDPD